MKPKYDFSGQVALVTGAASGLGLATAQQFASAGAAVVIADVNAVLVAEIEQALREACMAPTRGPMHKVLQGRQP